MTPSIKALSDKLELTECEHERAKILDAIQDLELRAYRLDEQQMGMDGDYYPELPDEDEYEVFQCE